MHPQPECQRRPFLGKVLRIHYGIYPILKAQIRQGAEPNATGRVGVDGETGDFKGLTLSTLSLARSGAFL
jgi:hypothetical protein